LHIESSPPVARPAPAPALDPRRWRVLAHLCGAFFMVILDTSIVANLSAGSITD
jgi:hypothetical protein